MVKKKLIIFILFICFFCIPNYLYANPNSDQWIDTEKTYKDLIDDGYEVKAYSINTIEFERGLKLILFVTVLQKNNSVYECQEYQTLDSKIETLDLKLVCRELVQPFESGLGT